MALTLTTAQKVIYNTKPSIVWLTVSSPTLYKRARYTLLYLVISGKTSTKAGHGRHANISQRISLITVWWAVEGGMSGCNDVCAYACILVVTTGVSLYCCSSHYNVLNSIQMVNEHWHAGTWCTKKKRFIHFCTPSLVKRQYLVLGLYYMVFLSFVCASSILSVIFCFIL